MLASSSIARSLGSLDNIRDALTVNVRPHSIDCDPSIHRPDGAPSPKSSSVYNALSPRQTGMLQRLTSTNRWHSDTNISLNPNHNGSRLTVDTTEINLNTETTITLYWDIKETVTAKDWIGLYRAEETHPGKWWDYRNRGVSRTRSGELTWCLERIAYKFVEPYTKVCFRYYHGNSGDLRAVSETIVVFNPEASSTHGNAISRVISVDPDDSEIIHLALTDIEARHVRKGMFFNPDPYMKIRIEPGNADTLPTLAHHYTEARTTVSENTTEPRWPYEVFHFMALPTDSLFFKLKDRFTSSRPTLLRFLGQVCVPIRQVVERAKNGMSVTCQLMGRSPHDNVCGSIIFKPSIIPYDPEAIMLNNQMESDEDVPGHIQTIDSVVEAELERRSAADILSDTSTIDSETENDPFSQPPLVSHAHNSTSGDSGSLDLSNANSNDDIQAEADFLPPNFGIDQSEQILPEMDTLNVTDSIILRPTSPDVLTSYMREQSHTEGSLSRNESGSTNDSLLSPEEADNLLLPQSRSETEDLSSPAGAESHQGETPSDMSSSPAELSIHISENQSENVEADVAGSASGEPEVTSLESGELEVTASESGEPEVTASESGEPEIIGSERENVGAGVVEIELSETEMGNTENGPTETEVAAAAADVGESAASSQLVSDSDAPVAAAALNAPSLDLADGIFSFLKKSGVEPPSPSTASSPDVRSKPKPAPRQRTMAEQLSELNVIETVNELPPELPAKRKGSQKVKHNPPLSETRGRNHSLTMPTEEAPPPPKQSSQSKRSSGESDEKQKKKTSAQAVAETYGSVEMLDVRPKVRQTANPPTLHPRKKPLRSKEDPPRLPPRRSHSRTTLRQKPRPQLNDVFEPPPGSSTEATVAAEVANASASTHRSHQMRSEAVEAGETLPSGWEARVDAHGRVFYIDHHNRVTTWSRPTESVKRTNQLQRVPSISNAERVHMDHRYASLQRMGSVRDLSPPAHQAPPPPIDSANRKSAPTTNTASSSTSQSHNANTESNTEPPPSVSPRPEGGDNDTPPPKPAVDMELILNTPAVKFLTRTDFFSLVQYSDEAQVAYTSNSALKHMVHKIRRDAANFQKYCHNKDLVNFVNMFVNKEEPLPSKWQMKVDKLGKIFFLDHSSKTTTFIDPRLPVNQPLLTPGEVLPIARGRYREGTAEAEAEGEMDLVPTAYNEKVVLFLRQPNIFHLLQDRYPTLKKNESLKNRISNIITDGTSALRKYRNYIELTLLLSTFENEIMSFVPSHLRAHGEQQLTPKGSPAATRRQMAPPYKRDFQEKYRSFLKKLEIKNIGTGPNKTKMRVRRGHILEDSFKKIMSIHKKDLQKNKLLISFTGEEGLDYGGPAREFFFLLSRELFNPYYGLFEYSANDTYTVQISPMSQFVDNAAEWFRFAGRMIGLCIVHQYLMDSFFTRPFYKMLLREPCVLSDLESLDAEFHQSLVWIKDNDISECGLDLTFSVDEEVFGQVTERELKPNGMNVAVTNKNKKEYIEKMVAWRIDRGVTEQKEHLMRGFYEIIDPKLVSTFDAKDLELVIAGTAEIDVVDWRNNTEYRSGYYDTHPIILWFWIIIESFDNENRLRLLQFVTGTSSIPFEGFSALRGSNGPRKFTIEKWGQSESLPRAHTCFNRLDLPSYTSKDTMREKLLLAISETSTFGIE